MTSEDRPFIISTWFKSFWQLHANQRLAFDIYQKGQRRRIERLLDRAPPVIVTPQDHPAFILGYAVVEGPTVHYTYVRHDYRKMGIASQLLQHAAQQEPIKCHSSLTTNPASRRLTQKFNLQYNPYAVET